MKCCISRFCKNARWVAAGTFMLIFTTSCVRITLPLLSKSLAKADSKFTLPPASLLALENGQKIHHLKVSQLTQFKNGSGVVIARHRPLLRRMTAWDAARRVGCMDIGRFACIR